MVRLRDLPTFTYREPLGCRTRAGKQPFTHATATNKYGGRPVNPRFTSRNVIDKRRWTAKSAPRVPRYWPAHLRWPQDVLSAVLYEYSAPTKHSTVKHSSNSQSEQEPTHKLRKDMMPCFAATCPTPYSRTREAKHLCKCHTAPWKSRNTLEWFNDNITLQHQGPHLGICGTARTPFPVGTVLGEYLGELTPFDPGSAAAIDSSYIFEIKSGRQGLAFIDAARVGGWLRFINHSCCSNADFVLRRVGREARVCVVVTKEIGAGEEITVNYGQGFWKEMMRRGLFCSCGTTGCKFADRHVKMERI
jgi:hypothetical protein